jgi:hypothetical protein
MALRPTDFLTRYDFRRRAVARLESGVRLDRGCSLKTPLGPRRPLSTPAGPLCTCPDWLGVASGVPRGSPTLTGSGRAFPRLPLNLFKSVASTNFAIGAQRASVPGIARPRRDEAGRGGDLS